MAEPYDTRGSRRRALAAFAALSSASTPPSRPLTIADLPHDQLVSIFMAIGDLRWVRHTVPCVCKEWNELYLSEDASPLHEALVVDFWEEGERARDEQRRLGRRSPEFQAAAQQDPRDPIVHASRVISWAQRRAGSVRKLHLMGEADDGQSDSNEPFVRLLDDFTAEDLGALLAVVGSSLTEILFDLGKKELAERPFWEALRESVVPAGRLRSLLVPNIKSVVNASDVEPLGQLVGSLEMLVLESTGDPDAPDPDAPDGAGLSCFPESVCSLTKLRRLALTSHKRITAIPAGISCLKKLEYLDLSWCGLSSLPKELGELSRLTKLDLGGNITLGFTPEDEAFPAELGNMASLRKLDLHQCHLRTVPAFVGELKSLEVLDLSFSHEAIVASLDFLIRGCPLLRWVPLFKNFETDSWTPESLAHLKAFEKKLLAKNPSAKVFF